MNAETHTTTAVGPGARPLSLLLGFALLLALVFAGAFAGGRAAGPLSPGLRPATGGAGPSDGGMPGMPGTDGTGTHVMGAGR